MLRYVRTKDTEYGAIIDTKKYKEITGEDCYIPKDEIVAEAGTIEELCDEFVCGKNHLLLKLYELKSEDFKEDVKDIVYGAIWTNTGLIYVAKMNEKGEFELL